MIDDASYITHQRDEEVDEIMSLIEKHGIVKSRAAVVTEAKAKAKGIPESTVVLLVGNIVKGIAKGIVKGQNDVIKLVTKLQEEGRFNDIVKFIDDSEFRTKLFKEYGID